MYRKGWREDVNFKKSPLVCQHLEMVSRRALERYRDVLKQFVKRRHGIYALYRKNRLYYVGLAKNLRSRLRHHLRDRHAKTWDHFSVYLTIESNRLRELEALAIRIAAPKGNLQRGRLNKSQDLRRIFRKTVAERLKKDLRQLFEDDGKMALDSRSLTDLAKGRKPVMAGYFDTGKKLRLWYKSRLYRAYVKKSGAIRFKGKIYTSPSVAASAITHRPMNGWCWWKFERAPGDWVKLDELRK